MKKLLLTLVALLALVTTVKAQNIVQVNSGELRQLCVGEGQRAKAWVDDRDATLWGHNNTDTDDLIVYVKYVDKNGKEHKIYPRLPKGTLPNHNAQKLASNASYVIEVGWGR